MATSKSSNLQHVPDQNAIRRLLTLFVPGDYMSPTIKAGDAVEVDTTISKWVADGVYLLNIAGQPALRHVQRSANGRFSVWQSSSKDLQESVPKEQLAILGRAVKVWSGKLV